MIRMVIKLFVLYFISIQCLIEGYKISSLDNNKGSHLLDRYGCLEHINVTVFMAFVRRKEVDALNAQFKK